MRYMQKSKLTGVVLAFGLLLAAKTTFAQATGPYPEDPKSLADRLDDFTRTVFGGLLPGDADEQPPTRTTDAHSATKKFIPSRTTRASSPQRAGSILSTPLKKPSSRVDPLGLLDDPRAAKARASAAPEYPAYRQVAPNYSPPSSSGISRPTSPVYSPPSSGGVSRPARPVRRVQTKSPASAATATRQRAAAGRSPTKSNSLGLSNLGDPVLRPLHERLQDSRKSVFKNTEPSTSVSRAAERGVAAPAGPTPAAPMSGEPTPAVRPTLAAAPPEASTSAGPEEQQPRAIRNPAATSPRMATRAAHPGVASEPVRSPAEPATSSPPPDRLLTTADSPRADVQPGVLLSQSGPVLNVRTIGPKRISVGKEAAYQVTIQNAGEVGADEVVVYIQLPEWADVLGAQTRSGAMRTPPPGEAVGPLEWEVGNVPAGGSETLALRIVPRERRPFDLGVRFAYKPVASQTMIEVEEPKLDLSLEGPHDILYGKKEIYRLQLANTGNGDAEGVTIKLLPIGGTGNQAVAHHLGTLAAGQRRAIEVELTARQVGNLKIRIEVDADAGVHAELAEDVFVRRAGLKIEVLGPSVQYVGTEAEYRIRVSNPGTSTAENLRLAANIPTGAKYLSGIEGVQISGNGTKLQWTVESLNASSEQTFVFKCSLGMPGSNRIEVLSAADGDLTAVADAVTRVEALADLVLDVQDPAGPVPVGQEVSYELRIRNRGTKNAVEVQVVGYFSRGIEPIKGEGGPHRITAGQILFSPIPSVAAGKEVVLKIRARAEAAGNHVFRTEVHCKPLGTRLVSEESTYFYVDQSATAATSPPSGRPAGNVAPVQVADPPVTNRPLRSSEPSGGPLRSAGPPVGIPVSAGLRRPAAAPAQFPGAAPAPPVLPRSPATQPPSTVPYNPATVGRTPISPSR